MARFLIALGEVAYNLFSARLWISIALVIIFTHLLSRVLFGVGLIIGDVAEFSEKIVDVIFNIINTIANDASKVEHGVEDFFTGHFGRLSHEGDYAARTHLTTPPVLSQLARLRKDIGKPNKSSLDRSLVEMIQLIAHLRVCPALAYFRTITLSRWVINGFVDCLLPSLCNNDAPEGVQVVLFLFDGLPRLLGWIGTTGVVLWLVLIEGWPLIRFSLLVVFEVTLFAWSRVKACTRSLTVASQVQRRWSM